MFTEITPQSSGVIDQSQNPDAKVSRQQELPVIKRYMLEEKVVRAEILWALETVHTHSSFRSAGANVALFREMFPDSQIAAKMEMGRTKAGYIVTHGLGPYFSNQVLKSVEHCTELVVAFDETLNKISKRQQLDVGIRFWSAEKNQVEVAYVGSAFLSSTRSADLSEGLKSCFSPNPALIPRICQISMDGPNVNLKLSKDLCHEIKNLRNSISFDLLNIGSCGLHVVHNSFKNGNKRTGWSIDDFLQSLYYLFKDVPLRRADYAAVTGSDEFPLKFCSVRWVENQSVAARAIKMLPNLRVYIRAVKSQQEKKLKESSTEFKRSFPSVSKSKAFRDVADAVDDRLIGPKLTFFMSAAATVEPFLHEFQTDAPMVPFLFTDLIGLIKPVMSKVLKPECLKVKVKSLVDIQLNDANLLDAVKVDIGFAAKAAIKSESEQGKIPQPKLISFYNGCKQYYIGFLEKMLERSPLKYPLTRYLSCLDPGVISTTSDIARQRFDLCLEILVEKEHLSGSAADKAKEEFSHISCLPSFKQSCLAYKRCTRLDNFWSTAIGESGKALVNLLQVVKKILILSHGNATIERGFSVNKECLVENLTEESLVAQRLVYDAVLRAGTVNNVEITKSLMHYAKNAHSRYTEAMQKKKLEKADEIKVKQMKREAEKVRDELEVKRAKLLADTQREIAILDEQMKELKR